MKFPRSNYVVIIFNLFAAVVLNCKSDMKSKENSMENILGPRMMWQQGTWWIIRTSIIDNISPYKDGPEKLGVTEYFHRYKVIGRESIGQRHVWIVDVNAVNVPSISADLLATLRPHIDLTERLGSFH